MGVSVDTEDADRPQAGEDAVTASNEEVQVRSKCQECHGLKGATLQDKWTNDFYWEPCRNCDGNGYLYRWVPLAELLENAQTNISTL